MPSVAEGVRIVLIQIPIPLEHHGAFNDNLSHRSRGNLGHNGFLHFGEPLPHGPGVQGKLEAAGGILRAGEGPEKRAFAAALEPAGLQVIAEIKRASPSKGVLCPDLDPVFVFPVPAGTATGEGGCTANIETELDCNGDPSIPGFETGTLLKWEPPLGETCEPDVTGTMVVVFYSSHDPYPIDADALGMVIKFSGESCVGHINGVFPAVACDSVPTENESWGGLKGLYR